MIDSVRPYSTQQAGMRSGAARVTPPASEETGQVSRAAAAGVPPSSMSVNVSPLARQLAASAARADERDRTLSRSALAATAKNILDEVAGEGYYANKAKYDAEIPQTDDPALLARAKQATAYIADVSTGGHSIQNPFAGLSREELGYIIYDDSGSYTVNERHAAYRASYDMEQAWRQQVVAQAMAEYHSSGKLPNFFSSVLDHFEELPAIEQAQYPADYASDLASKIRLDFNYRTGEAGGGDDAPMSLIDMLFAKAPRHGHTLDGDKKTTDTPKGNDAAYDA